MKFSATAIITVAFTSFATATLHYNALCVDHVAGQNVYNDKATRAACGNYFMRNTGGEQWDTCPDCGMQNKGGVDFCHSDGQHIGGDEMTYYCELNGAATALSD